MFDKILRNQKIIILIISIFAVISIFLGTTYALFYNTKKSTYASSYAAGTLSISGSGEINIDNAIPTDDIDGLGGTASSLTITNNGNLPYRFNVKLFANDETEIAASYMKVSVDGRMPFLLSEYDNSIILSDELLLPGDSITFEIRIWLDIDTPSSEIGKSFAGKITTDGYAENMAIDKTPAEFDGDGTASSPYLIKSIEDLIYFSNQVRSGNSYSGKYIRLVNSLNFNNDISYANPNDTSLFGDYNGDGTIEGIKAEVTSGRGFLPIGEAKWNTSTKAVEGNAFYGTFDGNNRQILGLYIVGEEIVDETDDYYLGAYLGLFATNAGTIKNLTVSYGRVDGHKMLGGIAGGNAGTISNCVNKAAILGIETTAQGTASASNIGGIVGINVGTISNCKNYGLVKNYGTYTVGGIVGWVNVDGNVSDCVNYGTIEGIRKVGGLIGALVESSLTNCTNRGLVYGLAFVGGISGRSDASDFSDVVNKGYILGFQAVGGIVGHFSGSSLASGVNYGSIYYTDKMDVDSSLSYMYGFGGIVGDTTAYNLIVAVIEDSINYGIVGASYSENSDASETNTNGKNLDFLTNSQGVGGIVGIIQETDVTRCGNYGKVNGWSGIGGVVGQSRGNVVQLSFNKGNVTGERNVGGVVGLNMFDSSYASTDADILSCFNLGNVTGIIYSDVTYDETNSPGIGGIVGNDTDNTNTTSNGFVQRLDVKNSYNVGSVSFPFKIDSCAGVVGRNYAMGSIAYCYSVTFSGSVNSSLVGKIEAVDGSYDFTDVNESYLYTANYMKMSDFVTELNTGLDESVWVMDTTDINNGFPVLSWMVSS